MGLQVNIQKQINGIKRTSGLQIFSTYGGVPFIRADREIVTLNQDNTVASREPLPSFEKFLNDSPADQVVEVNGKSLNAAEIAEAVSKMIDLWDPA
jgi:hypothetical protein